MNIFVKIKNSIYNPGYYQEVIKKPFSYAFKYLLVFALLFALVFTVVATLRFIPVVNMLSQRAPELANYFPQELTVTIKDGKVSTNVQEPYFVKAPSSIKDNNSVDQEYGDIENLVVINTKEKLDLDKFKSYKTLSLVTSDSVVYVDKQGKISISSLSGVKDFILDRSKVLSFINTVKPFVKILYPIVFVGAFIGGFVSVLVKMVYLFFGALLVWLVAKIKGIKLGYKKSYIVGMQLITGAIILTSILTAVSAKFTFPYFFSILLVVLAFLNLKKTEGQPVMPASATPIA